MYSWGQLRLLLQQDFPGVSLDKIDAQINARYSMILGLQDWKGLEKKGWIETIAQTNSGTINATPGSTAVSGTGTNWPSTISGMQLLICGSSKLYTVTWVDASDLTLDRPFEGYAAVTAAGYNLIQSIYPLPDDCRQLRVIQNPTTGLALTQMTELEFAQKVGLPTLDGTACYYIPQPDTTDPGTGAIVQQIQLYPLPTMAYGYPIVYEQAAPGFDGVSTNAGPLAFVSDFAILEGARADLYSESDKVAKHEGLYQKHLQGMIHQDNGRREARGPVMDPAYTRHRAWRLLRQYGGTSLIDGRWGS